MMFGDLATLNGLKRNKHVLKHIIWDIEPKQLMEPRHRITEEGKQEIKPINGYLFYIDTNTVISMKTLIIKSLLTSLC